MNYYGAKTIRQNKSGLLWSLRLLRRSRSAHQGSCYSHFKKGTVRFLQHRPSVHDVKRLTERWMGAIDYLAPRIESASQRGKLGKFSFVDWSEMLWRVIIKLENILPKEEDDVTC